MKSIYEASVVYGKEHQGTVNIEDFQAGANYVLGEVEKMFSRANKYKDGSDHTILYLDIEFLIEQLKK